MSGYANNPKQLQQDAQPIAGITKYLMGLAALVLAGVSYTPAQVKAILQGDIDATNAVLPAKAAYKAEVVQARAARKLARAILKALKAWVLNQYGTGKEVAEFGFSAAPPRKPSTSVKAAAVQQTKATRSARHTMGKRQRKTVKGTVAPKGS